VLHGQRAEPRVAQSHGYAYRFPTLQTGLADVLG
jgi:NAD dependent epimerase/dehydratase family enzyme